jgi:hypothetical protein
MVARSPPCLSLFFEGTYGLQPFLQIADFRLPMLHCQVFSRTIDHAKVHFARLTLSARDGLFPCKHSILELADIAIEVC